MRLCQALVAFMVIAAETRAADQPRRPLPSPQVIRERVASAGPASAMSDIAPPNPDESTWPLLVQKVAEGSKEWLEVAELLAPGADAGYSLELRFAVTRALAREPAHVLGILDRVYATDEVCGDVNVFMGFDSYAAASAELSRWTQGVAGVSDPSLRVRREACRKGLTHLNAELGKNRRKWFAR